MNFLIDKIDKLNKLCNFKLILAIFGLALIIRLVYLYFLNIHIGFDSSYYLEVADKIKNLNFNPVALIKEGVYPYYWLFPLLLLVLKSSFLAVVIFQILLQSVSAVFVYLISLKIFNKSTAIIAGLIYAFLWDLFSWDVYVLTDSIHTFFLTGIFLLFILFKKEGNNVYKYLFYLLTILLLFLRPTVVPFMGALVILFTWGWSKKVKMISYGTGGMFILLIFLYAFLNTDNGEHLSVAGYFTYFVELFRGGVIIHDRHEYDIAVNWDSIVNSIISFFNILIVRLVAFWYPFIKAFSLGHKIISGISLMFLYIFGTFKLINVFRGKEYFKNKYLAFIINFIVFLWLFHVLTEIDYDWRYRVPILPFLILLSASGFVSFLKMYDKKNLLSNS